MTEQRIAEGAQFMLEHRARLEKAHKETGVAPEYVVAIIGVETFYGRITGKYRVLDALATLAFDYPPRARILPRASSRSSSRCRARKSVDPLTALGSYAGAMGAGQFMPSSYRRYAVDGSDDQQRNLFADWDDIIASVANYFKEHRLGGRRPGAGRRRAAARRAGHGRSRQSRAQRNRRGPQGQGRGLRHRRRRETTPVLLVPAETAGGPVVSRRLQEFRSDHALQPQRALRHGGARPRDHHRRSRRRADAGAPDETTKLAAQPAAAPTAAR